MTRLTPAGSLKRLERISREYGEGSAAAKLELLDLLQRRRLSRPQEVLRLHEVLCYLRAYPDNAAVLIRVEQQLGCFEKRQDLRSHRDALADTGIAGTPIHYRFFWPTARWLARRWPDQLHLDWDDPEAGERLGRALPQLLTFSEAEAIRLSRWPARQSLKQLCASTETDATFWVRRIEALPGNGITRETLHDTVDMDYRLEPAEGTPSRTHARYAGSPVAFRTRPASRLRPDLRQALRRAPQAVRSVGAAEGARLIELANVAMVTRSRSLEVFEYGNPEDVRIVDDGDGLQFVCIGILPARRQLLHASYGYLTLRSGMPLGYVQSDVLLGGASVSFNTFETFRGADAAQVFGRMLAMLRHLFATDSFSIEPYQLGRGNAEGIESGAWWFYYKLGFRPRDPAVRRVLRAELSKMRRNPGHRSNAITLGRLASAHLFYDPEPPAQSLPAAPWPVGLYLAGQLARRAGADRERAVRECSREAAELLGLKSFRGWSPDQREVWQRWCPLILALPGISSWSQPQRTALVRIVQAKGAPQETDFLRLFADHPRAPHSLLRLVETLPWVGDPG